MQRLSLSLLLLTVLLLLCSVSAQEGPTQNPNKRPLATKSSNTWICIVVAGVTGIIVYFIGQAEKTEQERRFGGKEESDDEKEPDENGDEKKERDTEDSDDD
tara:strand:- start:231 stop:536 length:306 start_codon:yes stop_codon:yes gene_type:complete